MMKWIKQNDVILRVTSLVIAILLWSYVMSTDDPEKNDYFTVPIQIQGINELNNRDLVVMSGTETQVTVKAIGKLSELQKLKENYQLMLNPIATVSQITKPGEYDLAYAINPSGYDVTYSERSPETVTVVVDRLTTVSIPVEVDLTGVPETGLTISNYHVSPDAIPVRGPETILKQIAKAKVVYDVSGLKTSMQTNVAYQLLDSQGKEVTSSFLSIDTPSVVLDFTLKRSDAVDLTVEVVESPYLTRDMIEYTIEPGSLQLEGSLEAMQDLNQISLGSIDLNDVVEDDEYVFERLILLPNGVSAKNGQSRYATITVNLKDSGWQSFELEPSLVPENPLFTYAGGSFEVEVFGPNSVVSSLRPESFILEPVYDLDQLIAGENLLSVKVSLADERLLVRGDVKIIASVTEEALEAARDPQPAEPVEPTEPSDT